MFETKGRKNIEQYVNGNLYTIKKPVSLGGSIGVVLPKDWLDMAALGRELRYFLLDVKDGFVVVKPWFDKIEGVDEE